MVSRGPTTVRYTVRFRDGEFYDLLPFEDLVDTIQGRSLQGIEEIYREHDGLPIYRSHTWLTRNMSGRERLLMDLS